MFGEHKKNMDGVFSTQWGNYVARSVESMVLRCLGTQPGASAEAMWDMQCRLSGQFLNDAAQWVCMDFLIRHYPAHAQFQVPASSLRFDLVLQRFVADLARSELVRDKKLWTMMPQARMTEICTRLQACMKRVLTKHVRLQQDASEHEEHDALEDSDVRVVELEGEDLSLTTQ